MSIIYPSDNQAAVGASYPNGAVDGTEWSRTEPLLTVDQLKSRYLFGIPLVSAVRDPISGKAAVMTDAILKDRIIGAVDRLEVELNIMIRPVAHQVRLPFDRNEYMSFGFMQLPSRPVSSIQSIDIVNPNGQSIFRIPNTWVAPGHLQIGQLSMVPLQGAFSGQGTSYLVSPTGQGAPFLGYLAGNGWVPEYFQVSYVSGFPEDKTPRMLNDLIAIEASIDILSQLQATDSTSSRSIGVDGLSQSVGTAGPQKYQARIDQLKETKEVISGKLKGLFGLKMFSTSV